MLLFYFCPIKSIFFSLSLPFLFYASSVSPFSSDPFRYASRRFHPLNALYSYLSHPFLYSDTKNRFSALIPSDPFSIGSDHICFEFLLVLFQVR